MTGVDRRGAYAMDGADVIKSIDYLKIIVPAFMLVIGWGTGLLTSMFIEKKKNEHAIISKIVQGYYY